MILGVTGTIGAGKETVVQYLKKKGFAQFSFSRMIRQEARRMGKAMDRRSLQEVGDSLRQKYGDEGIFAKRIVEKIKARKIQNAAVDSIRSPWEIEEFRRNGDFILLAVDADQKIRFERTRKRKRMTDVDDFGQFRKFDEKEIIGEPGSHQQIGKSVQMSDFRIMNNGSFEELYSQIDAILEKLHFKA